MNLGDISIRAETTTLESSTVDADMNMADLLYSHNSQYIIIFSY